MIGIEPRSWLVAKKQFRIERERTRQANSLFHPTADFVRLKILKTGQSHHLEFLFHDLFDFIGRLIGVLQKWQRHIFADRE